MGVHCHPLSTETERAGAHDGRSPNSIGSGSSSRKLIRSPCSLPSCKERKRRKSAVSALEKPMPREKQGLPTQTSQGASQNCPHESSSSFYFNPLTLEIGAAWEKARTQGRGKVPSPAPASVGAPSGSRISPPLEHGDNHTSAHVQATAVCWCSWCVSESHHSGLLVSPIPLGC